MAVMKSVGAIKRPTAAGVAGAVGFLCDSCCGEVMNIRTTLFLQGVIILKSVREPWAVALGLPVFVR